MLTIKLENIDNDATISIFLNKIINIVRSDTRFNIESVHESLDNTKKCAICSAVVIGIVTQVSANVLCDIIKSVFSNNPKKKNDCKIIINGKSIQIKDINNITINIINEENDSTEE